MTVIISGTDGVSDVDGSASTPAIRGTDANTGIFFPAADTIAFAEGGAEAMRITSDGRLGIGTTSPNYPLNVQGSGDTFVGITGGTSNVAALLLGDADNKSIGRVSYDNSNNSLQFWANESERARISSGGFFKASNTGSFIGANSTYYEFRSDAVSDTFILQNTSANFANSLFEVNAVRNTTNNTFFALSYYNSTAGAYKFRVADSGNVTNTNNSYGSISDVKLKQDIVDAGSQWDDIKNLRVRKYHWKSDPDGFMQMGLVAQEAELVSPGLIDESPDYEEVEVPVLDDDGNPVLDEAGNPQVTKERNDLGTVTKSVKYSVLYMKAVKALQEAMERIETLEAKVAALEGAE
jgi:hypothetical protein